MNQNSAAKYLKFIVFAHYFLAIIVIPVITISFVVALINSPEWYHILFFLTSLIFQLPMSICMIISANYMNRRQSYLFSVIIACLECFLVPYGMPLGIITLVVLSQESVKSLYNLD